MKISEFIKKLEEYKNERGDLDMLFSVNDYYGGSFDAKHTLSTRFWENTSSNGKQVRFDVDLESVKYPNEPIKNAKITFRK